MVNKISKLLIVILLLVILVSTKSVYALVIEDSTDFVERVENKLYSHEEFVNHDIQLLKELSLSSSITVSAWAANILKFADTLTYTEQYILPDASLKRGEVQRRSRYDKPVENSRLKVYPNPAHEYVIIEYALEGDGTGYMIKLADANGFLRQTIKPEANRGFAVMDTRRLETGTFIAIVSKDGKFVVSGKFIVVN